jgi:hypothetical protein
MHTRKFSALTSSIYFTFSSHRKQKHFSDTRSSRKINELIFLKGDPMCNVTSCRAGVTRLGNSHRENFPHIIQALNSPQPPYASSSALSVRLFDIIRVLFANKYKMFKHREEDKRKVEFG